MSRYVCQVTKKRALAAHNVSHSNRKTKRWMKPNVHRFKFRLPGGQTVRLDLSKKGLKLVHKLGIEFVVNALGA